MDGRVSEYLLPAGTIDCVFLPEPSVAILRASTRKVNRFVQINDLEENTWRININELATADQQVAHGIARLFASICPSLVLPFFQKGYSPGEIPPCVLFLLEPGIEDAIQGEARHRKRHPMTSNWPIGSNTQ